MEVCRCRKVFGWISGLVYSESWIGKCRSQKAVEFEFYVGLVGVWGGFEFFRNF